MKGFSNRQYLDKLKHNLRQGDSSYIKNAMLLNALGEKEIMRLDTQNDDLNQSQPNMQLSQSASNFRVSINKDFIPDQSNYSSNRSPADRKFKSLKRVKSMNAQARPVFPPPSNRQMIRLEALINARSPDEAPST